jgi:hypothetical protein
MSWRSNPDNKKTYIKNYHRQRYLQRKDAGVCTSCGKAPARLGKALCERCAQREAERQKAKYANQTKNFKRLIKAVKAAPFEFAAAMSKNCEYGCIMDMFGCSERCGRYQDLTCDDCIRDWMSEEDNDD